MRKYLHIMQFKTRADKQRVYLLLTFILLLSSLHMHTQETTRMRLAVRPPGLTGYTDKATVNVNGKEAVYTQVENCYEFEAVIGQPQQVEVTMPGAETARLRFLGNYHSNSIERYDVQLGLAGCQYLREGFRLNPVQPDDSRIGIIKPGQTDEAWKNAPELKSLLDSLGLEVDSGYGISGKKADLNFSRIIIPFLILKRKDDQNFDASNANIYKLFEIKGYKWGILLMKNQLSLATFPFTLNLISSAYYSSVISHFETLDIKSSTPSNSTNIQITPYFIPGTPASWIELINKLGEIEGVKSVSLNQYTYRTLGF